MKHRGKHLIIQLYSHFNWLWLFGLVLFFGVSLSIWIILFTDSTTPRMITPLDNEISILENKESYLIHTPLSFLERLTLRRNVQGDLIFRPKQNDYFANVESWSLVDPFLLDLDNRKVSDFLSRILTMQVDYYLEDIKDTSFNDLGFNSPYMVVTAKQKNAEIYDIFMVGKQLPLDRHSRYVYSDRTKKIGVISTALNILEKPYIYFNANQRLLDENEKISSIEWEDHLLHNAYRFEKKDKFWDFYVPRNKQEKVQSIFNRVQLIMIDNEIKDLPSDDAFSLIADIGRENRFQNLLRQEEEKKKKEAEVRILQSVLPPEDIEKIQNNLRSSFPTRINTEESDVNIPKETDDNSQNLSINLYFEKIPMTESIALSLKVFLTDLETEIYFYDHPRSFQGNEIDNSLYSPQNARYSLKLTSTHGKKTLYIFPSETSTYWIARFANQHYTFNLSNEMLKDLLNFVSAFN